MLWAELPLDAWMLQCVPGDDAPHTIQFPAFSVDTTTERTMYLGLEKGLNDILEKIGCSELYTAIASGSKAGSSASGSPQNQYHNAVQPDMAVVLKMRGVRDAYERKSKGKIAVSSDAGYDAYEAPRTSRTVLAYAEVVMDIKSSECSPSIWDTDSEEPSVAAEQVQSLGRLAEYGREVFRRQHRCFLFAIAVDRARAAFVRFDRNGAVVSETFDYITSSRELGNFFYRLFRMRQNGTSIPRELCGHDPTAELACESCTTLFRDLHKTRKNDFDPVAVAGLEKAATKGWPIYCLSIKSPWSPDGRAVRPDDPVETHRVLVGRPLFSSLSMMGRGTRGFVGWDLDADRPVFVKDSWRTESDRLHSELEIYHQLWSGQESQSVEVTHIPTVLGGGDVITGNRGSVQRTRTQQFVDDIKPDPPRVHSRIVLKEIGRRLKDFEHVYELGLAVFGALQAHQMAYERKILHRDISLNNILIVGSRDEAIGLLCDWDLAKTLQQLEDSTPTRGMRLGTWQYMSALLQRFVNKRHELSDDLESFVHIFSWSTVRYFLLSMMEKDAAREDNERAVSDVLMQHFDVTNTNGYAKYRMVLIADDIAMQLSASKHPFAMMRLELVNLLQEHYRSLGMTLTSVAQPMGRDIVRRKPRLPVQSGNAASPVLATSATAQTVGAPGPGSSSTPAVIDLTDDSDTSARSRAIPKTPKTSPLYTHAQFMAIMDRWLDVGWPALEKHSQPLKGVATATSTPAGSRASSGSRRSSEEDINTRPYKQSKYVPSFVGLGGHLSDPDEEEDEQDTMDVENQSTPKKTHTANFKATHDTRAPSNAGSSKGSRRSGKK